MCCFSLPYIAEYLRVLKLSELPGRLLKNGRKTKTLELDSVAASILRCQICRQIGAKIINLLKAEDRLFLLQSLSFSLAFSAFFPLSFFSSPILSGVFQMNSLSWPRFFPYGWFKFYEKDPAYCAGSLIWSISISSYCWTTFAAAGPLGPSTISKVTRAPSVRDLKPSA